jgi:hypothetical protein
LNSAVYTCLGIFGIVIVFLLRFVHLRSPLEDELPGEAQAMAKRRIASLGLAALLMAAACERMETTEDAHPDLQAAINAGVMQKGWIPQFLPPSTRDIRLSSNLDTNEVWLHFSMNSSDRGSIENACRPSQRAEMTFPRRTVARWWPGALTEERRSAQRQEASYLFYHCEDGGSIAVEEGWRSVFYWNSGRRS